MKTLTINGRTINIPSWNTYSKSQLLQLAKLAILNLDVIEFCTRALFILTGLDILKKKSTLLKDEFCYWIRSSEKIVYLIGENDLAAVTLKLREHFFREIRKDDQLMYEISSKLYKSTLDFVQIGKKRYYSPSHALSNLIFEEYIYTETYFSRYLKDKNIEHIYNLISIIYRPKPPVFHRKMIRKTGDKRAPFNIYECKARAPQFKKLSEAHIKVIMWYYIGCRNFIFGKFSDLFRSTGSGSGEDPFDSFNELTTQLSGSAMNNEKVRRTLLYDVLTELNEKVKHAQKHK